MFTIDLPWYLAEFGLLRYQFISNFWPFGRQRLEWCGCRCISASISWWRAAIFWIRFRCDDWKTRLNRKTCNYWRHTSQIRHQTPQWRLKFRWLQRFGLFEVFAYDCRTCCSFMFVTQNIKFCNFNLWALSGQRQLTFLNIQPMCMRAPAELPPPPPTPPPPPPPPHKRRGSSQ